MQFKNIMCHCQQDGFCLYVDMPFCQEATVVPVSLDIGKSSLCLDAAVDTQLNAMFARDTRQVFLLFLLENLGHLEMFYALIKRLLAVVAMNAVRLARAVLAAFAGVAGLLTDKTSPAFCMTDAADHQLAAFATQVGIFVRQVLHVLPTPDVMLPFSRLAGFVVVRLDVGRLFMCLEIGIIFLALIASVGDDVRISPAQMLMHAFQEGDERGRVCRLREYVSPDNELCLTAVLDVVGRLQLAVLHGVLFHTHEGSVCICLGEAVPASAGVQFPMIVLQPPDVFVKRFRQPLQWRFASADAVHEDDALLLLVSGQSAAQLFEMMHLDGFAVPNTDAGIRVHLLQKIRQLSLQLGKIFLHGFLPDESILVGGRLNLGTVDEDVLEDVYSIAIVSWVALFVCR